MFHRVAGWKNFENKHKKIPTMEPVIKPSCWPRPSFFLLRKHSPLRINKGNVGAN